MGKKSPGWVLPVALALVALGLIEDLTVALIGVGLLTSFVGVALLVIKRPRG